MKAAKTFKGALAASALILCTGLARAQDEGGGQTDPEEVKKKILEIERLMKGAEEALARTTDTRSAAERAAEAAKKILEDKVKKETGGSSADLRKKAESGSKEAQEALERLTKAANEEAKSAAEKMEKLFDGSGGAAGGAGKGVKELIQKIKGDGDGAVEGIKWLLKKVKVSQQSGGGGGQPKPDEKKPEEKPDQPQKPDEKKPDDKKPESKREPPKNPDFEQWIAELPPQVRKAYDTQDWDSIPPKWREMIRAWADKLSKEDGKDRR